MENFEKTFEAMIGQFFNINLYGPSGCGKTYLLNKVVNDSFKYSYLYIKFNLSDFYSKKNIFGKITKYINNYLISKSKDNINHIDNLNKWYDLYQCLDNFKNSSIRIYFIIDSILDMDSFNYYKKEIIKLFVALKSTQNMKIILISNFDITNSEIQSDYDFSSIIPLQFPVLKAEELKDVLSRIFQYKMYDKNKFDELVNTCIQNFQYNFSNLNEMIFNIDQNLHMFNNLTPDARLQEFHEKSKYIQPEKPKKDKKEKSKEKNRDKDKDIEMKDEREKKKYDSDHDEKEKENKADKYNKEKSKHNSKYNKYRNDIYTTNYIAINDGIEFTQQNIRQNIKNQTGCAPIHEMKLDSFFKKKDISQIQKEQEENKDSKKFNQAKNLTESLSKSQKILLLASYFASEISAKNDKMFFKAKKSKGAKKAKRKNNTFLGHNLKSNFGNPFNIHRLIAIYQSLLSSCEINFQDDDIMVKCEITSLEKLGLIKNISGIDSRTMDQKYITKINLELARKIAEDFDIRLEDYIKVESLD